ELCKYWLMLRIDFVLDLEIRIRECLLPDRLLIRRDFYKVRSSRREELLIQPAPSSCVASGVLGNAIEICGITRCTQSGKSSSECVKNWQSFVDCTASC